MRYGLVKQINEMQILSQKHWMIASLEYASYNSILLIPILIGLKRYTYKNEKSIATIVSGVFLILAIVLFFILSQGGTNISDIELPLIHIVKQYGIIYQYVYGIVIVSAIYTSAISAGYGFVQNCSKTKKSYKTICMLICITAIPMSKMGFSYLVSVVYPIFGLLGLIQIIYILFHKTK